MINYIFRTCSCCKLRWQKVKFREITYRKVVNCLDLNQLSLFFGRSSKLCHYPERQLSKRPWEFWCGEGLSSWGVSREEFQPQKPEPLRNSSLKNLNPWGIPAWKSLPKPLRNSSIKNLNHWGIPASKTWTCEEFQPQKYRSPRNSSLNCCPWGN